MNPICVCGSLDIEHNGPDHQPFYCRKCGRSKFVSTKDVPMPWKKEETIRTVIRLDGSQVLELLRDSAGYDVPTNAFVGVTVQGKQYPITGDQRIQIVWEKVTEKDLLFTGGELA